MKQESEILTCIFNLSISERTHPMLPSPLQIKIRKGSKWRKSRKPSSGPVETRSKTCAGLSNCLKRRKNLTPWLSPDLELTKTRRGEKELPRGFTTSHESSTAIEWRHVGGITETLPGPNGHLTSRLGRHAVCTVALHHKQRQSCSLSTEPHVLSQWLHFADTGKFPSCHWCGIMRLPSGSSIISLPVDIKGNLDTDYMANKCDSPIDAKVVHLQFDIAFAAHRLWTLNLQTSHDNPCEVTPERVSRHTYQ